MPPPSRPRPSTGPSDSADSVAEAAAHLARRDPSLGRLIDVVGVCGLERRPAPTTVAAVAEAVVAQQLTGRAATAIYRRLCQRLGDDGAPPTAAGILGVGADGLRQVGLSRAKATALVDLADRARSGALPSLDVLATMDDEAVVAALTVVRGVGRWTAEMVLIFRLGRLDVLAVDDLGLRKGLAVVRCADGPDGAPGGPIEPVSRAALAAAGDAWRPYRSVASWYLWRAAERPELLHRPRCAGPEPDVR